MQQWIILVALGLVAITLTFLGIPPTTNSKQISTSYQTYFINNSGKQTGISSFIGSTGVTLITISFHDLPQADKLSFYESKKCGLSIFPPTDARLGFSIPLESLTIGSFYTMSASITSLSLQKFVRRGGFSMHIERKDGAQLACASFNLS